MQNFSKNWKLCKFLVHLAMVLGTLLTVGRGLIRHHFDAIATSQVT